MGELCAKESPRQSWWIGGASNLYDLGRPPLKEGEQQPPASPWVRDYLHLSGTLFSANIRGGGANMSEEFFSATRRNTNGRP